RYARSPTWPGYAPGSTRGTPAPTCSTARSCRTWSPSTCRSWAITSERGGRTMRRKTRPMTGEEYLESLRDDREVYLYGERVKDVTVHPAFRNPARMIARLYDALHDPKHSAVLVAPTTPAVTATPTGSSPRRTASTTSS